MSGLPRLPSPCPLQEPLGSPCPCSRSPAGILGGRTGLHNPGKLGEPWATDAAPSTSSREGEELKAAQTPHCPSPSHRVWVFFNHPMPLEPDWGWHKMYCPVIMSEFKIRFGLHKYTSPRLSGSVQPWRLFYVTSFLPQDLKTALKTSSCLGWLWISLCLSEGNLG